MRIRILVQSFTALLLFINAAYARPINYFWEHEESKLKAWAPSEFTRVENFNPSKFRFVYHNFTAWDWPALVPTHHGYQVAKDPDFIVNNPKISASVIDQDHRKNFGRGVGLILDVPVSNLIFTSLRDAMSPWSGLTFANIYNQMKSFRDSFAPNLFTPTEILAQMDQSHFQMDQGYNEIGVMGSEPTSGEVVKVEALVITAKALGCETDNEGPIQNLEMTKFREILMNCHFSGNWMDQMVELKAKYPVLLLNL